MHLECKSPLDVEAAERAVADLLLALFARGLQVHERLTRQLADRLAEHLPHAASVS